MIDHIVQINDLSEPSGGASKLAVQAAYDLARRGRRVTFVTGDAGRNPLLESAGVEIVALGQRRLIAGGRAKAIVNGIWNRAAFTMLRDWIASNDTPATVYHLHGWAQILSPSIFRALEPVRDRLVISAHDFFLACPNGAFAWMKSGDVCPHIPLSRNCLTTPCDRDGVPQKAWRSARQMVQRQAFRPRSSPPVLAIHDGMRALLARCGIPEDTIVTLPNPVTAFSESRIPAERNRDILFVGRLEETKGADLAARAAARAGASLTIIGEGPLADRIRGIHPAARLVGRRPAHEIRQFAADARMLVMPSRYPEPFGLVAIEAAWSGLPVILSETALLGADMAAAGAGFTVDPRDTAAFSNAMRAILDDDAMALSMSEAAYSATRSLALTPSGWLDRIEAVLYERLAGARTSPARQIPCRQIHLKEA